MLVKAHIQHRGHDELSFCHSDECDVKTRQKTGKAHHRKKKGGGGFLLREYESVYVEVNGFTIQMLSIVLSFGPPIHGSAGTGIPNPQEGCGDHLFAQGLPRVENQVLQQTSLEDPPLNLNNAYGFADTYSAVRENNVPTAGTVSGAGDNAKVDETNGRLNRPRRRTAAGVRVLTDAEISDDGYSGEYDDFIQEAGSTGQPTKRRRGTNPTAEMQAGTASVGGAQRQDESKAEKRDGGSMTGRFGGRLASKEDEKRLVDECILLAPYFSEDGQLNKLPSIIRAMASGAVRKHLETQNDMFNNISKRLALIERSGSDGQALVQMGQKIALLEEELGLQKARCAILEERLLAAGLSTLIDESFCKQGRTGINAEPMTGQDDATGPSTRPVPGTGALGTALSNAMVTPALPASVNNSGQAQLPGPVPPTAAVLTTASQVGGLSAPFSNPQLTIGNLAQTQETLATSSDPKPISVFQQQQQQHVLNAFDASGQPPTNAVALPQQLVLASQGSGMLRSMSANHLGALGTGVQQTSSAVMCRQCSATGPLTISSSVDIPVSAIGTSGALPNASNAICGQIPKLTSVNSAPVIPSTMAVAKQPSTEDPGSIAASGSTTVGATAVAVSNLAEQAQQLANQATLHAVAKAQASHQAQNLVVQANQYAQASVQAAQQAEDLKRTIAEQLDPHAAVAVQSLEAQAQAHASMTTRVVEQARQAHSKAQAHEREQVKAFTQASVLQAHASSLQASTQRIEIASTTAASMPHNATAGMSAPSSLAAVMSTPFTSQQIQACGSTLEPTLALPKSSMPASSGELANQEMVGSGLPTTPHSAASGSVNETFPGAISTSQAVPSSANAASAGLPVHVMLQPTMVSTVPMQLPTTMAATLPPTLPPAPATAADAAAAVDSAMLLQQVSLLHGTPQHQSQQSHGSGGTVGQSQPVHVGNTIPLAATISVHGNHSMLHSSGSLPHVSSAVQPMSHNAGNSLPLCSNGAGNDQGSGSTSPSPHFSQQHASGHGVAPSSLHAISALMRSEEANREQQRELNQTANIEVLHRQNHIQQPSVENQGNPFGLPDNTCVSPLPSGSPATSFDLPNHMLPERSQPLVMDPEMAQSGFSLEPVVTLPKQAPALSKPAE